MILTILGNIVLLSLTHVFALLTKTFYLYTLKEDLPHCYWFLLYPQGFSRSQLHPLDVVVVIAATEDRVGRKFSPTEIRDGTFASFIRDEDFDILNKVSVLSPFSSRQVDLYLIDSALLSHQTCFPSKRPRN